MPSTNTGVRLSYHLKTNRETNPHWMHISITSSISRREYFICNKKEKQATARAQPAEIHTDDKGVRAAYQTSCLNLQHLPLLHTQRKIRQSSREGTLTTRPLCMKNIHKNANQRLRHCFVESIFRIEHSCYKRTPKEISINKDQGD